MGYLQRFHVFTDIVDCEKHVINHHPCSYCHSFYNVNFEKFLKNIHTIKLSGGGLVRLQALPLGLQLLLVDL